MLAKENSPAVVSGEPNRISMFRTPENPPHPTSMQWWVLGQSSLGLWSAFTTNEYTVATTARQASQVQALNLKRSSVLW